MTFVVQCPKCGWWRLLEPRKTLQEATFKCFYCRYSRKIHDKVKGGLSVNWKGPFDNNEALRTVQGLNKKRGGGND
ncbi:MAG TPA: hypothetical protein ENH82_19735 [bacterium]|nr:hypothetical protein [bacterium]